MDDDDFDDEDFDARRGGGSGRMINILGKSHYDFKWLGASQTKTVVLRKAVRVVPWYYYWLGVRVHAIGISSGSFAIETQQTLPSRGDPAEFSTAVGALSTITLTTGTSAPSLVTPVTGTNLGPYLKFQLKATQGAVPGDLYAEISIVLFTRAP